MGERPRLQCNATSKAFGLTPFKNLEHCEEIVPEKSRHSSSGVNQCSTRFHSGSNSRLQQFGILSLPALSFLQNSLLVDLFGVGGASPSNSNASLEVLAQRD